MFKKKSRDETNQEVLQEFYRRYPGFQSRWATYGLNERESIQHNVASAAKNLLNEVGIEIPTSEILDLVEKLDISSFKPTGADITSFGVKWQTIYLCTMHICSQLGFSIDRKIYKEYTVYIVKQKVKICKNFPRTENGSSKSSMMSISCPQHKFRYLLRYRRRGRGCAFNDL